MPARIPCNATTYCKSNIHRYTHNLAHGNKLKSTFFEKFVILIKKSIEMITLSETSKLFCCIRHFCSLHLGFLVLDIANPTTEGIIINVKEEIKISDRKLRNECC